MGLFVDFHIVSMTALDGPSAVRERRQELRAELGSGLRRPRAARRRGSSLEHEAASVRARTGVQPHPSPRHQP